MLADLFLQAGIPIKAAPLYANYLENSEDPEMLYRLALAYSQLGQPEKSLQCFSDHASIVQDYDLHMLQGEICYRLHQYREAQISFSKAAACDRCKNGQACLLAGYAALQMHDFARGREAFKRAAQYKEDKKAAAKALAQLVQLEEAQMAWVNSTEKIR